MLPLAKCQTTDAPRLLQGAEPAADPNRELTTEEKEAGLGSVFKRDDERLAKMRDNVRHVQPLCTAADAALCIRRLLTTFPTSVPIVGDTLLC